MHFFFFIRCNFQVIQWYKALSAEEAEQKVSRRNQVMNYWSLMCRKRLRNDEDSGDTEAGRKAGNKLRKKEKEWKISKMDKWMESDDDDDDSNSECEEIRKKVRSYVCSVVLHKRVGDNNWLINITANSGTDSDSLIFFIPSEMFQRRRRKRRTLWIFRTRRTSHRKVNSTVLLNPLLRKTSCGNCILKSLIKVVINKMEK